MYMIYEQDATTCNHYNKSNSKVAVEARNDCSKSEMQENL